MKLSRQAYAQVTLNYASVTTHAIQADNTQVCLTLHSTQVCSRVLHHDRPIIGDLKGGTGIAGSSWTVLHISYNLVCNSMS